jgi:hypothetical protein
MLLPKNAKGSTANMRCVGGWWGACGQCKYVELIDTIFTDVEGVD